MTLSDTVSALHRFGLGPRPGELAAAGEARAWLRAQLRPEAAAPAAAWAGLPGSLDYLQREAEALTQRQAREGRNEAERATAQAALRRLYQDAALTELDRRQRHAVSTPHGFAERLARFWTNHFAISADKRPAALYAGPMEREAIRPHVFGHFGEMLGAVARHPGMLRYLDNARSVGEDSLLARRARRRVAQDDEAAQAKLRGLNENLAREILELHTVGADGGYGQEDVRELARALTGWSLPRPQELAAGRVQSAFVFRPAAHEAGSRRLLGQTYAEDGQAQAAAMLAMLARHPATARHLSYKLARHFVADRPNPALVARMAAAWLAGDGALTPVYAVLIDSPESWGEAAYKFKTPDDFLLSALRALGELPALRPRQLYQLLERMGQPPATPRSPAGFPDDAAHWGGPDALWKRLQAAQLVADAAPAARAEPLAVARELYGAQLDAETLRMLRAAESPRAGLALLFACPTFQWRA